MYMDKYLEECLDVYESGVVEDVDKRYWSFVEELKKLT